MTNYASVEASNKTCTWQHKAHNASEIKAALASKEIEIRLTHVRLAFPK